MRRVGLLLWIELVVIVEESCNADEVIRGRAHSGEFVRADAVTSDLLELRFKLRGLA